MNKVSFLLSEYLLKNNDYLNLFIQRYKQIVDCTFNMTISTSTSVDYHIKVIDLHNKLNLFYIKLCSNKSDSDLLFFYSLIRQAAGDNLIYITRLLEEDLKDPTNSSITCNVCNFDHVQLSSNKKIFKIEKLRKYPQKIKRKTSRNSFYRGISKTGNKWQVLLTNKKSYYYGCYESEIEAAKVYDMYALRHFGPKTKTNFYYTEAEKRRIYKKREVKIR